MASFGSEWYFLDDDHLTQGPITALKLREWFACGFISLDTLVFAADGSTHDWAPVRSVTALASLVCGSEGDAQGYPVESNLSLQCAHTQKQSKASSTVGTRVNSPPVIFIHDSDIHALRKYERLVGKAKLLSGVVYSLLAATAGAIMLEGPAMLRLFMPRMRLAQATSSDSVLLRVVMAWVCAIAVVLFLAEVGVQKVRFFARFLAHRSGRSMAALFAVTLLLGSSVCEPLPDATNGTQTNPFSLDALYERILWPLVVLSVLLVCCILYNARVTKYSKKVARIKHDEKTHLKPTGQAASGSRASGGMPTRQLL